jgi:hypothetical protein
MGRCRCSLVPVLEVEPLLAPELWEAALVAIPENVELGEN